MRFGGYELRKRFNMFKVSVCPILLDNSQINVFDVVDRAGSLLIDDHRTNAQYTSLNVNWQGSSPSLCLLALF